MRITFRNNVVIHKSRSHVVFWCLMAPYLAISLQTCIYYACSNATSLILVLLVIQHE